MKAASANDTGPARVIAPLAPEQDAAAALLLAPCASGTAEGAAAGQAESPAVDTPEAAAALLASLRRTEGVELAGLSVAGELLGVSATRRLGMTMELKLLVVAAPARRQGHGKELLIEALVRAGRRPTVTEVREVDLPFYKAMRFKPVARKRQPDGSFRFRLGWHPPGQRTQVPAAQGGAVQ